MSIFSGGHFGFRLSFEPANTIEVSYMLFPDLPLVLCALSDGAREPSLLYCRMEEWTNFGND